MFPGLELKEGWATVVLLLLLLLCVAVSIRAAAWTQGLSMLQGVVLLGGITGIVLAKSRIPSRMAHLLSALGGLTWTAYLTSRFLIAATGLTGQAAVMEIERRLHQWVWALSSQGASSDNTVFLLLLGFLLWAMAYFCAWSIFRWQHVWVAVIVCGLALLANITYASSNLTGYLIAFLLFALLLVVRTSVASYEQEWRVARVGYSPELVYSFLRAGFIVSIATILLAWATPKVLASRPLQQVWYKLGEPWRRLQEQSSRVFPNLNYQNQPAFVTFTRSTRFGGPVDLSDAPVMDVQAAHGRYWRVAVFHEYTSDGWDNTDLDIILIDENEQGFVVPAFKMRREVTQTITLQQDLGPAGTIAAAGQPLRAGLPLRVAVSFLRPQAGPSQSRDATPFPPAPGDPSVLYSRKALKAGETYRIVSSLTQADEESLYQAGTDYPDWVVPRYLHLPDSVPDRVRVLAEQITAGLENPYDKALLIENYLRRIPYNERIEGPAPGQDGVDYFLFDAREGYCDYYASAMVVMLRAVGVPARYVRGYSQTQRKEGVYHILEKDGHAWPEVFFPGYGWIEFEPTASEPVLLRPRPEDDLAAGGVDDRGRRGSRRSLEDMLGDQLEPDLGQPIFLPAPETFWQRARRWAGLLLLLGTLGLVTVASLIMRRRRHIQGLSVAERVYADLVNWAWRLLQVAPLAHQTPHEYAGVVARLVPQGHRAVEQIADLYVQERFGGKVVSGHEAETAWQEARSVLWRCWAEKRLDGLRHFRELFQA